MHILVIKITTEKNLGISYSKKSLISLQKYLQFLYEENFSKMAILYSMVLHGRRMNVMKLQRIFPEK